MRIQDMFEKRLDRPINGVVKADQLDASSVWQELDEFVVTKELTSHLRHFFSAYLDAIDNSASPEAADKIGVWVSGFFGSGKSHFIKVLSYLLSNQIHSNNGHSKQAIKFFEQKIDDALLFGDIKRAVASHADVILFNIDSKADSQAGHEAILSVFLKVLNEMQGYSGDHPHLAHMERYLDSQGKLEQFHAAYRTATGTEWVKERDAYQFNRDEVVTAFSETLGQSRDTAKKWIDGAEGSFALTVENFCKWVKDYLDSKGPEQRLLFLVDEVGQFIGGDPRLMLNLQTITENLGTRCRGRAWVVVTSQEDIDAVLGEMKTSKANDFSKIQGRFTTRLSLSSANVDEVIQSRLLAKQEEVKDTLVSLFDKKGDVLKHQLTFSNVGMTMRPYQDSEDFVRNYPFAPYQFQLMQKIFEAIRRVGATGLHLSRGERSILDAFQSAGKQIANEEIGVLVPLYRFYPSIESFLDTAVKRTIDQAGDNPSLEPYDRAVLQALFLIRYVDEVKGTVDNLVTLCIDEIDADRLVLRRQIEDSLQRLEKETLINRSGDIYFFLTNEERDVIREIQRVELDSGAEARLLGEIIFSDVFKGIRKHRFAANKMDFSFNRLCDQVPFGPQSDGVLLVSVVTPLAAEYELYDNARCILDSNNEGGHVLARLGNDESLGRELQTYLKTDKYIRHKNDGAQSTSTQRILRDRSEENQQRRERLTKLLADMLVEADYFVAGQTLTLKSAAPQAARDEALEYLVQNTFSRMGYLKRLHPEPLQEIQAVLRSNDIDQLTLALQLPENNPDAIAEVRSFIELSTKSSRQIVLHDMLERYALRPYGWPELEALLLVARLVVLGEIHLRIDGAVLPLDKVYEAITNSSRRRRITVLQRRTADPKAVQNARSLGKQVFAEMGPDGEDAVCLFLQNKLKTWQTSLRDYKPLADTGHYPGKQEIDKGLALIGKLVAFDESYKFIEEFTKHRNDLLDLADQFHDVEQFYDHQRRTWDKLRRAYEQFQRNRLELERDEQAAPALGRMHDILTAPSPYGLIKDADGLIDTVGAVNTSLVSARREQALEKMSSHLATLTQNLEAAKADAAVQTACSGPLEALRQRVETEESLAHIVQIEGEALNAFDAANQRLEDFVKSVAERDASVSYKKQRVIEPAKLAAAAYLETMDEVESFLDALRQELENAIQQNERIQIR